MGNRKHDAKRGGVARQGLVRRTSLLVAVGTLTLGTLTACGGASSGSSDSTSTSTKTGAATATETAKTDFKALLPADIASAGKISVATTPTYPPYEYLDTDGKTIIGMNADVMEELGKLFGVEIEWSSVAQFGTLVPGIASGRYDTAIIFEDIPERQKVVDLVDFYRDALAFLGAKDAEFGDATACGKSVAVGTGNGPALLAPDLNKVLCTDKGLPSMDIKNFANTDGQFTALTSRRVDYVLISSTVAKLFVKENPDFDLRSDAVAHTTRAIPVAKEKTELRAAFEAGLQELIDNGTMKKIMDKWDTADGFVPKVTVNVAGSVK